MLQLGPTTIKDVRDDLGLILESDFQRQVDLLPTVRDLFGSETASAALGALAESLVMAATGAQRPPRNNKGFDLYREGETIEVKSRYIANWGKDVRFDLRKTSSATDTAYYIVWDWKGDRPLLLHAFVSSVEYLRSRWPSKQPAYWMRTDLRRLLSHLEEQP